MLCDLDPGCASFSFLFDSSCIARMIPRLCQSRRLARSADCWCGDGLGMGTLVGVLRGPRPVHSLMREAPSLCDCPFG